jgi:myo-inositol-1(or 4)-monophosphatase
MSALDRRFAVAVSLCEQAAAVAMDMRPPPGAAQAEMKGPQDWVTAADGAVERLLSQKLLEAFPEDGFQGEENGIVRAGTLRWIADPIDGTANYARGAARFCVSLACLEGDTPLLGILIAPALRETISARLGQGAFLNGVAIHCATTARTDQAIMEVGWSRRRSRVDYLHLCEAVLASGSTLRHGGSGALGLADVAIGRIDGYAELHINLWDVAAALVILREAGVAVSDFMSGNGPQDGNSILACSPGLASAWSALPGLSPIKDVTDQ